MFCDLPTIPAGPVGKFIVQQMAAVAELERGLISQRTKAALAQSKKKLGGYRGGKKPDAALATQARPANDAQVRGALKALFQQVENPSAYNAFRFAAQMRTLNGLLP